MERPAFIPAAQYLRMSTENQQYSMQNQIAVIEAYAAQHGFAVVRTYSDAARSGVLLKNRPALNRLLGEVVSGLAPFTAVLVYDVSRWGRFQDSDEAAHYEFLCKRAQIRVEYCAETFANDDTLASSVMKAVKRAMAAEYSRELGDKVFSAEKRWAELGFKQGGVAGYALSRVMVASDGTRKQLLSKGEVKCLQSDRVVLVPGDPDEVKCVREMFRLVADEKRTPYFVARDLNRRGLMHRGHSWAHQLVYKILTDPKYAGYCVWNRSTRRLGGPNIKLPISEWVLTPGAFNPIVEPEIFQRAQSVLSERTCAKSREQFIESLRIVLIANGKLTGTLLSNTPGAPSASACRKRFGSLRRAFELAGYSRVHKSRNVDKKPSTGPTAKEEPSRTPVWMNS